MRSEPANEELRQRILSRLGLLDGSEDQAFDRLAKLAARLLDVPIALVTLATADRLLLKGIYGIDEPWRSSRELPITDAFCQHVVASGKPLAMEDAATHTLARESATIRAMGAMAYLGMPLRAPDGSILGAICVIDCRPRAWDDEHTLALSDLTAIAETEIAMRQMERSWQETQRLESLGVLAGGIAHDFNNLLATILGNTELALLDMHDPSPIRESLEQVELAARQAAQMTQQILAYAGKGRVALEPIKINTMVGEMAALLRSTLLRQAQISYRLSEDLPLVEGDISQLRQVVMNVIVNAAEAINSGPGTIIVSTDLRTITARSSEGFEPCPDPGAYICLEVRDSGPGMSRATIARIFEPFFTTKLTGRGLGLAAVQGIVRSHRGALRVESTLGEGTTFSVLLPALIADKGYEHVSPKVPNSRPNLGQGAGLILIVEDEIAILQLTARMLRRLGYTPLEAASHDAAVALLQLHRPWVRCVLLDWTMPGRSGSDAVHSLIAQSAQTPIIVMSGYSEQVIDDEIPEFTSIRFLHKPFTAEALQRAIAQAATP